MHFNRTYQIQERAFKKIKWPWWILGKTETLERRTGWGKTQIRAKSMGDLKGNHTTVAQKNPSNKSSNKSHMIRSPMRRTQNRPKIHRKSWKRKTRIHRGELDWKQNVSLKLRLPITPRGIHLYKGYEIDGFTNSNPFSILIEKIAIMTLQPMRFRYYDNPIVDYVIKDSHRWRLIIIGQTPLCTSNWVVTIKGQLW